MFDQDGDVAPDAEPSVEEGALGRHRAGVDARGGRGIGDDAHVGVCIAARTELDGTVGDAHRPPRSVDDLLLDRQLEIGGRPGLRRGSGHLTEPLVGQKRGHVVRLWARPLVSAFVGPERRPPAKLTHRLGARVLDVVTLTWALFFVLVEIDERLLGGDPWGRQPLQIDLTEARPLMLTVLVVGLYEVVPLATKGATLGKALFGLRVVSSDRRGPLPWARTLARTLVLYGAPVAFGAFGGAVLLVLLVSLAIPASGRGLHDRIAGSVVVVAAPGGEGS